MQVDLKSWMLKNECAWGQKYASKFFSNMKKWDADFQGYWQGGTYDIDVLDTQLNYIKDEEIVSSTL